MIPSVPHVLRIALIWLPAGAFSLHCKWVLLQTEGFRLTAVQLGRHHEAALSLWEKLVFFGADFGVSCVLFPLLLLFLAAFLPRKIGNFVAAWVAMVFILVHYVQIRAFLSVGQFLDRDLILSAARWGWENPHDLLEYDSPTSLAKMAAMLVFIGVVAGIRRLPGEAWTESVFFAGIRSRLGKAFFIVVLAAALIPWLWPTSTGLYHSSIAIQSFSRLAVDSEGMSGEYAGHSPATLLSEYRNLSNTPPRERGGPLWGQAKGYNLIFFVMETAPAAVLTLGAGPSGFPHLDSLQSESWVALRHFSTYPYTNRALFSLFTSLYPSNRATGFLPLHEEAKVPGLIRSLAEAGYATAAYFPMRQTFESDEKMFIAMGVQQQRFPTAKVTWKPGESVGWKKMLARDQEAVNFLVTDIAQWSAAKKPFVAAIFPQVGHGPWQDIKGNGESDVLARGREVIRLQDEMLGQIVSALHRSQVERKTLIVITGDHGLRTSREYPPLVGGLADSISFHVPLMIHAPGISDGKRIVTWITSHIDVGPTLLDLLGIESQQRDYEQGLPIWDERIQDRTTYFYGRHYSGVDAFHHKGQFSMLNHTSQFVYQTDSVLYFKGQDPLAGASAEKTWVTEHLKQMASLQRSLLNHLCERR